MARLRAEIKRGFLSKLWRNARQSFTLDEALFAFQDGAFDSVKTGRLVLSTAGGGYSTSFSILEVSELTPTEVFALSQEFIEIKADALATLAANGTTLTGADDVSDTEGDTVVAAMLADDRMQGTREECGDFTSIRVFTTTR